MLNQDVCAFYNVSLELDPQPTSYSSSQDHAVYNQFNGIVLDEDEGGNIANALGDKKACYFLSTQEYY